MNKHEQLCWHLLTLTRINKCYAFWTFLLKNPSKTFSSLPNNSQTKNFTSFKRGDVQICNFHACHKTTKKECSVLPKLRHLLLSAVCWNNRWVLACKLHLGYATALRIYVSLHRVFPLPENSPLLKTKPSCLAKKDLDTCEQLAWKEDVRRMRG